MHLLTIRQIQYIIALSEEKSFSRAAKRCGVTQSTLSAAIKEAETLLNHTIVDRSTRNFSFTGFGSDILADAHKTIEAASQISEKSVNYNSPMSAPIRLGIIPTIAPYMLPNLLPILKEKYPKLNLHIFEDLSDRLYTDLMTGKLDLIILALPYDTDGATQASLFDEEFYLATPSSTQPLEVISTQDLHPDDLLLLADGHCLTDHALQACSLQRPAQRRTYSASSLTTLIQMVANGLGQTLLPNMVVRSGQLPASVKVTPFSSPAPTRNIGMAWKNNSIRISDYLELSKIIKSVYL